MVDAAYAWSALDCFLVILWGVAPNMELLTIIILGDECDRLGLNKIVKDYFADLMGDSGTTCVSSTAQFLIGGYVVIAALVIAMVTAHGISRAHRRIETGSAWSTWRPSGRTFG
jgi:hypothetical protein